MQKLSGVDAAFVYLDANNTPMHVGGIGFFHAPDGHLDFEHYKRLVESRLHLSAIFRRRLLEVPFGLGRPYWIEDRDFDLDAHLHHAALPQPRGWLQLRRLAEQIFRLPLDLRRPLWSLTFVEGVSGIEGLPDGAFAVVWKVHHAAADGMGTLDLWSALWDLTPEIRERPAQALWKPDMVPGNFALLGRAYLDAVRNPLRSIQEVAGAVRGGLQAGREIVRRHRVEVPALFSAPHTLFNEPVTARRSYDALLLSLADVRAVRRAARGATVNDVVLAICSGALRRYLGEKDGLPEKSLVAMAPVSVRGKEGGAGNEVVAMLVELATDEPDPLKRLDRIHASAVASKDYTRAIGAPALTDAAQVMPFTLGTAAARLYSRMQVARYHRPAFNLVITNVPGPTVPLYLGGARMLATTGTAPITHGLGLIVVVTSYLEGLTISLTTCPDLVPDVERLVELLREEYHILRDAIGQADDAVSEAKPG